MTTAQDCSVGLGVESTYGTGVTPTRWFEFISEDLDFRKQVKQGKGLRVGARVDRSARRVVVTADAGGGLELECISKGLGLLWQACLGTGVSNLVGGTTYQQLFTLGDVLPSLTLQKGIPRIDGTVDAYTFLGATVEDWELNFGNADIPRLKVGLDARDVTTATAYAAPSYAAAASLFSFSSATLSSGTFTAPTTTALASAATPLGNVRGGSIKVKNGIATGRYSIGGAGRKDRQVVQGVREIAGKIDVEYASTALRDAILADTPMSLVLTYTAEALSTGLATLQLALPEIKLDSELVKANGGDVPMQSIQFTVLDNLTAAQPIWIVVRTSDAAL